MQSNLFFADYSTLESFSETIHKQKNSPSEFFCKGNECDTPDGVSADDRRPVDRGDAVRGEEGVGAGEMAAAEEAVIRRKRARMRRLENQVPGVGDQRLFRSGV